MVKKVLVMDDNMPSAYTLATAMKLHGYEARFVVDGNFAMDEIDSFVPDIVLCDINMPGMSGYELCEKMRLDERLKNTLFLAQRVWDRVKKSADLCKPAFTITW